MRVVVSVRSEDGTITDREPTEDELMVLAKRYAIALLQMSLPGAQVRIKAQS